MFGVAWLIVTLALRRSLNRFAALQRWKKKPTGARGASARKPRAGGTLVVVLSIIFLFNGVTQSANVVRSLARTLERQAADSSQMMIDHGTMEWVRWAHDWRESVRACPPEDTTDRCQKLRSVFRYQAYLEGLKGTEEVNARVEGFLRTFEERGREGFRESVIAGSAILPSSDIWYAANVEAMLAPLSLIALLLALAVILIGVAGSQQDLSKIEWAFEWWFTFPVPARGLLLARVLETAFANPIAWFTLFPFFLVVFTCAGYSWLAIPLGLASTVYVGVIAGGLRVVIETSLRRFFSLRTVSRVQATLSAVSTLALLAAIASLAPGGLVALAHVANRFPSSILLSPLFPLSLAAGGSQAWMTISGCSVVAVMLTMGATTVGAWMLRDGLTTGAGPHQGSRQRAARLSGGRGRAIGAVVRKELRLLFRDRTLFTQVFVTPVLMVGMQLLLNRSLLSALAANPRHAAAMAFATAALVLATGACNTLALEAPALWIYLTVPTSIDRVLIQKAAFWSGLAASIAVAVFIAVTPSSVAALLGSAPVLLLMVVGVVLNEFIATGIGMLGTDALETEPRRRIQPAMSYLYMMLATMFGYAVYAPSAWAKFAQIVLSALLAFALWQKVRDHAPFLLDPNDAPAPSIAVADGIIAALAFFVLQGILALCFIAFDCSAGASLLFAFVGSGLVVGSATLFILWRNRLPELLATLGLTRPHGGVLRGLLGGVAGGIAGGLIAYVYLVVLARVPFLHRLREETVSLSSDDANARVWFAILAIGAAPVFEEFIFRAVLYRGFRRSLGPMRAMVSSAIVFAIVHPAIASAPVFVLGFITAVVYERFRSLLAPIAAHMTYNAIVISLALQGV